MAPMPKFSRTALELNAWPLADLDQANHCQEYSTCRVVRTKTALDKVDEPRPSAAKPLRNSEPREILKPVQLQGRLLNSGTS
jgi:hypothetical protein